MSLNSKLQSQFGQRFNTQVGVRNLKQLISDIPLDVSLPVHDVWVAADPLKYIKYLDAYDGTWQTKALLKFYRENKVISEFAINRGDDPLSELRDITDADYTPTPNLSMQLRVGGAQPELTFQSAAAGPDLVKQTLTIAPFRVVARADRVQLIAVSHGVSGLANNVVFLFGVQILSHPLPV